MHIVLKLLWISQLIIQVMNTNDYYIWRDAKCDKNNLRIPPNNWVINKELVKEMKKDLRFWLDLGVDGYRIDAAPFLFEDLQFLDEPRKPEELVKKEKNTYFHYYHLYTKDLPETLGTCSKRLNTSCVMITESYTSIKNTMRYYGNETNLGAHISFNFELIERLNDYSNTAKFNDAVNNWLDNMPDGKCATGCETEVPLSLITFIR
ncbi:maltase A1-like [Aphis craccivora]|uniref:Maltase A1-like n=1 Tax=Aphis craccivora TaxID=307492 RepID=A0A6G0Z888_APHCR|nr:maltase A1-like [Aphis craccivora]